VTVHSEIDDGGREAALVEAHPLDEANRRSRHAVRPCLNVAPRDKRIEVVEDSCLL